MSFQTQIYNLSCTTDIDKFRCLAFNSLADSVKADGYRMADCKDLEKRSCLAAMYAYVLSSDVDLPNEVIAEAKYFLNSADELQMCGSEDADCYEEIQCSVSVTDVADQCKEITVTDIRLPL